MARTLHPLAAPAARALVCAAVLALAQPLGGEPAVTWLESYEDALEEARRTGKPIFLEFRCAP